MAGCGPSESTTDVVFGGHCLIAENGVLLAESPRVGDGQPVRRESYTITRDVDVARLRTDRRVMTSFDDSLSSLRPFRRIAFAVAPEMEGLERDVPGTPFVPAEGPELHRRCAEIFGIQCAGLAKRIEQLPAGTPLNIGISGGLDSTLSLLVAVTTCDMLGLDRRTVHGLTMPGFGTTQRTRTNALDLMAHLGVSSETIDISALALEAFREMRHAPFGIDCYGPGCRGVPRRAGAGAGRVALRPDVRERPGPAADVPADVQGVRRRHRRPLRAGAGVVYL